MSRVYKYNFQQEAYHLPELPVGGGGEECNSAEAAAAGGAAAVAEERTKETD